jgi:hypothetical protein
MCAIAEFCDDQHSGSAKADNFFTAELLSDFTSMKASKLSTMILSREE